MVTSHPDHVESLFKAKADDAPSLTGESPLRPILGPNSVLTSVGARHLRQRKLLLPPFHGEAVQRYVQLISDVAEREIDSWPTGKPFALAPRMQAVTLDVIMGGVFGIGARPPFGSPEHRMREMIRQLLLASTRPIYQVIELQNAGRRSPWGFSGRSSGPLDRQIYAVIRKRRAPGGAAGSHDVLSLLLQARDEDGEQLTDHELRDELLTLVLAGHETTANSLSWTFERLLRNPESYARLRALVRSDDRCRGVRRGDDPRGHARPTGDPDDRPDGQPTVALRRLRGPRPHPGSGQHRRAAPPRGRVSRAAPVRPERFVGRKPGTYTWIPFGGGIRRCLGASLAMAEQRVVLRAIARRTDLAAPDPAGEPARQRNVTMIPRSGGRVVVAAQAACVGPPTHRPLAVPSRCGHPQHAGPDASRRARIASA